MNHIEVFPAHNSLNKWVAARNGLESSPQRTKQRAISEVEETERFIRIATGCKEGEEYLNRTKYKI